MTKTLLSVQKELSHNYHTNQPGDDDGHMCFELLGFDIMLDHALKPILLEVNQAPSFATDSPLDAQVKRSLFESMFAMLGFSIDRKQAMLTAKYEERLNRMLNKVSFKQKSLQKHI